MVLACTDGVLCVHVFTEPLVVVDTDIASVSCEVVEELGTFPKMGTLTSIDSPRLG